MEGPAALHYQYVSENNHVESKVCAKLAIPFLSVCHRQTSGQMEAITYTSLHSKNMMCSKNMQQLNVG